MVIISSSISSVIITYLLMKAFERIGLTGVDIFKPSKPSIPHNGGLSAPITVILSMTILLLTVHMDSSIYLSITLSLVIMILIGLADDFFDLPGFYKPMAAMLAGLPLIVFATYDYRFKIVFGGGFSIPIIYVLAIPVAMSVTSNTVNMLDVINGSAAWGVFISLIAGLISSIVLSSELGLILSLIFISSMIGIIILNSYPADVFLGNAGSLSLGALIGLLAIIGDMELPMMVAIFPFIHNSFFFLSHVKNFVEHKRLNAKVTYLNDRGLIEDANMKDAPLTLLRFIVSDGPKKESTALKYMIILFILSGILAIVTAFLMKVEVL
jgi:UDP-N-acetylglucosamine--dolichyl-phosphate N-acetylglucosaminephosphotransferase